MQFLQNKRFPFRLQKRKGLFPPLFSLLSFRILVDMPEQKILSKTTKVYQAIHYQYKVHDVTSIIIASTDTATSRY